MPRRAKIVCTLGPASHTPEQVRALVEAGMDVARLNFSHGTHDEHAALYQAVRLASDASGRAVAVLADLQGPKIRLGRFTGGAALLSKGDRFTITTAAVEGDASRASTTYAGLPKDVRAGDRILVDDGRLTLRVLASTDHEVDTEVVVGGPVSDHKGINLPGVSISAPALTDKDIADLRFALGLRVDLVALSFVRSAQDMSAVRAVMEDEGAYLPILAKLEKPEAVGQLEAVVAAFDGLMVARGDLGVEVPLEQVPLLQKWAIRLAREAAKPVIVATQMLESMVGAGRPTRAEASDVANAVLDGADALMLSAETSVGSYPVESVATMARIMAAADLGETSYGAPPPMNGGVTARGEAIAAAATQVGAAVGARFLVAFTQTGDTARRLARHRGAIPLLAFTTNPEVRSQLALVWGVEAFLVPRVEHTDDMVRQVDSALVELGRCRDGDLIVVVAGSPPGTAGSTNAMRVHRVGAE